MMAMPHQNRLTRPTFAGCMLLLGLCGLLFLQSALGSASPSLLAQQAADTSGGDACDGTDGDDELAWVGLPSLKSSGLILRFVYRQGLHLRPATIAPIVPPPKS